MCRTQTRFSRTRDAHPEIFAQKLMVFISDAQVTKSSNPCHDQKYANFEQEHKLFVVINLSALSNKQNIILLKIRIFLAGTKIVLL